MVLVLKNVTEWAIYPARSWSRLGVQLRPRWKRAETADYSNNRIFSKQDSSHQSGSGVLNIQALISSRRWITRAPTRNTSPERDSNSCFPDSFLQVRSRIYVNQAVNQPTRSSFEFLSFFPFFNTDEWLRRADESRDYLKKIYAHLYTHTHIYIYNIYSVAIIEELGRLRDSIDFMDCTWFCGCFNSRTVRRAFDHRERWPGFLEFRWSSIKRHAEREKREEKKRKGKKKKKFPYVHEENEISSVPPGT